MRRTAVHIACLALLFSASLCAAADKKPAAKTTNASATTGKHYSLVADKSNTQWGWFDPTETPKLTIKSGDTVSIETWYHALDQLKPTAGGKGPDMDELVRLRKANPGGGPHSVTGPIYVEGAEPGDTLELRILKIVPKGYGQNFNLPGKEFPKVGLLAQEFPDGFVRYYDFDVKHMTTQFKPGIVIDLKPFPGVIATAPDPNEPKEKAGPPIKDDKGRTSTLRPWKNGSNMDLNELQAGSTLYLPVFVKGGLVWTGDSHCRQGNGEVNLEAIECAFKEIEIQPILHKGMKTDWPWAETKTGWVFTGFDEDLNQAMKIAVENTVDWLSTQTMVPMSRSEAYALTSITGDCRVTEVVDIRKGVHCIIPKSIFVKTSAAASSKMNPKQAAKKE